MPTTPDETRGLCLACNYPLTGLDSTRCPECGRPFDPSNPDTMGIATRGVGRWSENYRRRSGEPIPWLWPASLTACAASALLNILHMGDLGWALLGLITGHLAVAVGYWFRWKARMDMVRSNRLPPDVLRVDRPTLRRVRRAFLVMTLLLFCRLPFWIVFVLSLPMLNQAAEERVMHRTAYLIAGDYTLIGPFPVRFTLVGHGGVEFEVVTGHHLLYRPSWEPDQPYYSRHIAGRWFISGPR